MNPLNSIKKHLKGLEEAVREIKTVETRAKASCMVMEVMGRMDLYPVSVGEVPVGVPAETVRIAIPEPVGGDLEGGEGQSATVSESPVEAVKTPILETTMEKIGRLAPEIYKGNPVLEPVTDSAWEVGEPGPGVMAEKPIDCGPAGDPNPDNWLMTKELKKAIDDSIVAQLTAPHPEMRDGFPLKATITVASRCINPKLLAGRLGDGRQVSVERGFRNWKVGDSVECELLRGAGQPLYRQLNTRT